MDFPVAAGVDDSCTNATHQTAIELRSLIEPPAQGFEACDLRCQGKQSTEKGIRDLSFRTWS
jgi:hypothetical protein